MISDTSNVKAERFSQECDRNETVDTLQKIGANAVNQMTMEQTETLAEDLSSAKELEKSRSVLPDQWIQGWQEFEARIRERPGLYFLATLAGRWLSFSGPSLPSLPRADWKPLSSFSATGSFSGRRNKAG